MEAALVPREEQENEMTGPPVDGTLILDWEHCFLVGAG